MKNTFFENNPLTETQLDELWNNAIFIFDTNILLNLYRYSDETSKNFIDTILKLGERVWIPHQVGLEFHRNRLNTISEQKKHYEDFKKKVDGIVNEIENKNRNPFLSKNIFDKLISIKDEIGIEIEEKINLFDKQLNNDLILDKINSVFEGKVGQNFEENITKQIFDEGKLRYENEVPPGYGDIKKPEDRRYGDLIIWKQIIAKSRTDGVDIIFILDDRKDDWWLDHQGKTISPRPELLREFKVQTDKICHFYKPFQFLEYSNHYLGNEVKSETIEEVKNYKSEEFRKNETVLVHWTLQGSVQNLTSLVSEMKDAGYKIYMELGELKDHHELYIILPDIPDLERRLNAKYHSLLLKYDITLINKNSLSRPLLT